jgi:glycosyltransferase involved in cell wall biosynthesis
MVKQTGDTRKFLFITPFTIPETAGSGIHTFRFARYINDKGDCAKILTFNRNLRFRSTEKIDDVSIRRIPYFNKNLFLKLCSLPIVFIYYLVQIPKNDIIFIYGGRTFGFELIILISHIFRKKIIFRSLMLDVDDIHCLVKNRKREIRNLYRYLFKRINIYFSINKEFTERYLEIFSNEDKIFEMPQGVDTSIFYPVTRKMKIEIRQELNLPQNKFLILSVGFLIHRKGFEEIFSELAKLTIDFQYIIVGEYSVSDNHFLSGYKDEMVYLKETGTKILKDKIIFTGYQQDLSQLYQVADVFLINSRQEGLPNVLLEAMACKIPVITNSMQGVDGFLTNHRQNTLIFQNLSEIPGMIQEIYHKKKENEIIVENAYMDICNKYSFEKVYTSLLEKLEN